MTTETKTVFTLVNPAGQYLKYFYPKHTDQNQVLQFNLEGSQLRFHTCGSEKAIQKVLDKAVSMNVSAEIVEVEQSKLDSLKEQTKQLPRLRHMQLVEKTEKTKTPRKKKPAKFEQTLDNFNWN